MFRPPRGTHASAAPGCDSLSLAYGAATPQRRFPGLVAQRPHGCGNRNLHCGTVAPAMAFPAANLREFPRSLRLCVCLF